jgi:hypothetical protein
MEIRINMEMGKPEPGPKKFSFWKAWVHCFFSKELYADVGANWKGTGYGVLLLMILILSVLRGAESQWKISKVFPPFAAKIPPFKLEKGVFSAEAPQPYRLDFPGGAIVFDTTGRTRGLADVPDSGDLKSLLLVTRTQVFLRRQRLGQTLDKSHDLSKYPSFAFDRERLDRWTANIVRWSGLFVFFWGAFIWFLVNAATLPLYALLGVWFADLRKGSLDFPVALRLAAVSHFPAMIVFTALPFLGYRPSWYFLWPFLVSAGYLFFAVRSQEKLTPRY